MGVPVKPGCVVPSITTASVMAGSAPAGAMVRTPVPGIWKTMTSRPLVALASRIACWREPGPLRLVLLTTRVAAWADIPATNNAATHED